MTATANSERVLASGLVAACDDPALFGVDLTPMQRQLLDSVEDGSLLHVWALGRRSGKTLLGSLIALWSCLLRPELAEHVRRRERRYAVAVATNLRQARIFVEQARSIVEGSPLLASLVQSVTDDEITFKNRTTLSAFPCTSRGGRGWAVQCLLLDRAAVARMGRVRADEDARRGAADRAPSGSSRRANRAAASVAVLKGRRADLRVTWRGRRSGTAMCCGAAGSLPVTTPVCRCS